jgi:hypothetical protein
MWEDDGAPSPSQDLFDTTHYRMSTLTSHIKTHIVKSIFEGKRIGGVATDQQVAGTQPGGYVLGHRDL